jgi:uncharacterized membrane protein YbhN (UPF0104 family)
LPAGVYLQNYILGRLSHLGRHSLVRSTTATTAMLGLESAIAIPVAVLIGIPHEPWLRATILGIVGAWIVVLILAWLFVHPRAQRLSTRSTGWWQRLILIIDEFLTAGGELISLRTVRAIVPTAIYMLIYAIILYAVIHAAGANQITFADTLGIYAILVLAVIMVPIPTEIGITEFTGLGALLAYGLSSSTAAIVMVSFRILSTGATLLFGGVLASASSPRGRRCCSAGYSWPSCGTSLPRPWSQESQHRGDGRRRPSPLSALCASSGPVPILRLLHATVATCSAEAAAT